MKPAYILTAAACAAFLSTGTTAGAEDIRSGTVMTHPSQGAEQIVDGGQAQMVRADNGVLVNLVTTNLVPGNVHTLWFVVIAAPENCAASPCTGGDVLGNTSVVQADAGYAGGAVADANGSLAFTHFQPQGALINGWFERGLVDADTSEIHLVVKDHGPAIEGRLGEMLTTFREGCTTESINPAFPDVAFADGTSGPNTCALVQHAAFVVPQDNTN